MEHKIKILEELIKDNRRELGRTVAENDKSMESYYRGKVQAYETALDLFKEVIKFDISKCDDCIHAYYRGDGHKQLHCLWTKDVAEKGCYLEK